MDLTTISSQARNLLQAKPLQKVAPAQALKPKDSRPQEEKPAPQGQGPDRVSLSTEALRRAADPTAAQTANLPVKSTAPHSESQPAPSKSASPMIGGISIRI